MALSTRKQKFVDVFDGNQTEAAIKAGWSKATARVAGYRAMQDPEVVDAIQKRADVELAPAIATRTERQAFWTDLMRDQDVKPADRLRAAELLGRSCADFTDKLEVKGELTLRDLVQEASGKPVAAAPTPVVPTPEGGT